MGGPAAKAFKKLGVSVKDSSGKLLSPTEALDKLSAGLENVHDPAQRTALVMDLFGRSGAQLLPFLSKGPEGLAKLRAEVEELGAGMDETFIQGAREYKGNMARLSLALKGFGIQVIGPLLPIMGELTTYAVKGVKAFVAWIKQTAIIKTAFIALTGKGVFALAGAIPKLIAHLGGLQAVLLRIGGFLLRTVAPFLILEDIIVFLSGGKSALGKGLDAAFGKGTAANIQALVAEMVKFFGLFKSEPSKVRAAFATLPQDLEKDLGGFGSFLGGWGQSIVDVGLFATNALTGGWANFVSKAKSAGQGFLLAIKIVWTELKFAGLEAAAAMSDAFDNVWNSIIDGAQAALNALLDVLSKLPGTEGAVSDLRKKVQGLSGARGAADAREGVGQQRDKERLALAGQYDQIAATATAPAAASVVNIDKSSTSTENRVSVTVDGKGSDAEVGNRVGKAAMKVIAQPNLRAMKASLVPTPG